MGKSGTTEKEPIIGSVITKSHHQKLLGYAVLFIAIAVIAIILLFIQRAHEKIASQYISNSCSSKAAGNLLEQAHLPVFGYDQGNLLRIVQKIQKLPDYEYDPNCLYVVTAYYTYAGDKADAQKFMNELLKVYKPRQDLSPKLGPDVPAISTLQAKINSLATP